MEANINDLIDEVQNLSVYTKQEREEWINRIKSGDKEAIEKAKKIKKGEAVNYDLKPKYYEEKRDLVQASSETQSGGVNYEDIAEKYDIPEEDVKELYEEAEHLSDEQVEDLKSKESSVYWSAIEENRKIMQNFKPEFLPVYLHNREIIEKYQKRDYNKYKEDLKKYLFGKMLMNYKNAQRLQKEKEKERVMKKLKEDEEFKAGMRLVELGWGKNRIQTTAKWFGREFLDTISKIALGPSGIALKQAETIAGEKTFDVGSKLIKEDEKELQELAETYLTLKPKLKEIDKITTKDVLKGSAVALTESIPFVGEPITKSVFKSDTKTELLTSALPTQLTKDVAGGVLFLKGVKGGEKLAEKLLSNKGKLVYKELEKVGSGVLLYLAGKDLYESAKQSIEENNPEKFLETTAHLGAFVVGGGLEYGNKGSKIKAYKKIDKSKFKRSFKNILKRLKGEKETNLLYDLYGKKYLEEKSTIMNKAIEGFKKGEINIKSNDFNIQAKRIIKDKWIIVDGNTNKVLIAKWNENGYRTLKQFNSYSDALNYLMNRYQRSIKKIGRKQAVATLKERGLYNKYAKNLKDLFEEYKKGEIFLLDISRTKEPYFKRNYEKYYSYEELTKRKEKSNSKKEEKTKPAVKDNSHLIVLEKTKELELKELKEADIKRVKENELKKIKRRQKELEKELKRREEKIKEVESLKDFKPMLKPIEIVKPKPVEVFKVKFERVLKPELKRVQEVKIKELEKPKFEEKRASVFEENVLSKEESKTSQKYEEGVKTKSTHFGGGLIPIPLIPKGFGKGSGSVFKLPSQRVKFKTKKVEYKPSLAAIGLGITSTKKPKELTGLELRPVIVKKKSKKKKKKKISLMNI